MARTWTGRVAVVTGAGSGIGRELAYALGRRGCRLAISDVSEAGLEQTRSALDAAGVEVVAERLDVADRAAVEAYQRRGPVPVHSMINQAQRLIITPASSVILGNR